jgi:hypothetical protein
MFGWGGGEGEPPPPHRRYEVNSLHTGGGGIRSRYDVNALCTTGRGGLLPSHVHKTHIIQYRTHNPESRIQNTEYIIQNMNATHEHKITNVPHLHLIILMGENLILRPLEEVGHENFQGTPLPKALEMDLPASKPLRPAPYKQEVH